MVDKISSCNIKIVPGASNKELELLQSCVESVCATQLEDSPLSSTDTLEINITTLEVPNYYTCQACGNLFESKEDCIIELEVWPICCSRCRFSVIYNLLSKMNFSDEELIEMQKNIEKIAEIKDFKRHSALYSISKHYCTIDLSSITIHGTWDRTNIHGTNELAKSRDKNMGHHPLIRGVSFVPLSQETILPEAQNVPTLVSNKKKEGISLWF